MAGMRQKTRETQWSCRLVGKDGQCGHVELEFPSGKLELWAGSSEGMSWLSRGR